jgi:hypothetical protein
MKKIHRKKRKKIVISPIKDSERESVEVSNKLKVFNKDQIKEIKIENSEEMESWSDLELKKLYEGIKEFNVNDKFYWKKISEKIETKKEEECIKKYQENFKKKEEKTSLNKDITIFSDFELKGKINKKRKIRSIINEANKFHFDDIFNNEESNLKIKIREGKFIFLKKR